MNRYQNPVIFEPLAFSYAMGTLQGRARRRFEKLMEQHFFLRAVTQAYQNQLRHLDELLPEIAPSPIVWERISQHLNLKSSLTKPRHIQTNSDQATASFWRRFWHPWLPWSISGVSFLVTAVLFSLFLQHQSTLSSPNTYFVAMRPYIQEQEQPAVATAHVNVSQRQINFKLPLDLAPQPDQMATLWCTHKDPNRPPIRLGVLQTQAPQHYTLPMSQEIWQNLVLVQDFMIVLEPKKTLQNPTHSLVTGEIIFKGELVNL